MTDAYLPDLLYPFLTTTDRYVNHNAEVDNEGFGFSVIDARCFDGKTTTRTYVECV